MICVGTRGLGHGSFFVRGGVTCLWGEFYGDEGREREENNFAVR